MKTKVIQLLVAIMLAVPLVGKAQKAINVKSDTIKWQYGSGQNIAKSESMSISGYIITYGNKSFLWVQNGTDTKYSFDIKATQGEWLNSNDLGELNYNAVCEGITGTIRLYREKKGMSFHLNFTQTDKQTPNIVLPIISFSKL